MRARLAVLGSAAALAAGALVPVQLAGATPAAAAAYEWVALGDSYSAGVIPAAGDAFEVPRDGCERTDRSYPQVIDRDLGSLVELTNVSCGAATIEDITFNAQNPIGRHLPPFSEDPDYPFPPVPPQSEAVSPGTDVITVGAGGNTLGFAEILFTCLQLGEGSGGVGTPCRDDLADNIPARLAKVSQDYDEMLATAPRARPAREGPQRRLPHGHPPGHVQVPVQRLRAVRLDHPGRPGLAARRRPGTPQRRHREVRRRPRRRVRRPRRLHPEPQRLRRRQVGRGRLHHFPDQVAFVHPNAKGHKNAADHVSAAVLNALGVN